MTGEQRSRDMPIGVVGDEIERAQVCRYHAPIFPNRTLSPCPGLANTTGPC